MIDNLNIYIISFIYCIFIIFCYYYRNEFIKFFLSDKELESDPDKELKNNSKHKNKNQCNEQLIRKRIQEQLEFIEKLNPDDFITPLNNMKIQQIVLRKDEIENK